MLCTVGPHYLVHGVEARASYGEDHALRGSRACTGRGRRASCRGPGESLPPLCAPRRALSALRGLRKCFQETAGAGACAAGGGPAVVRAGSGSSSSPCCGGGRWAPRRDGTHPGTTKVGAQRLGAAERRRAQRAGPPGRVFRQALGAGGLQSVLRGQRPPLDYLLHLTSPGVAVSGSASRPGSLGSSQLHRRGPEKGSVTPRLNVCLRETLCS